MTTHTPIGIIIAIEKVYPYRYTTVNEVILENLGEELSMDNIIKKVEDFLEIGGIKKEITLLVVAGISLIVSIFDLVPLPFNPAWIAIILCGIPIILEATIGMITAFDVKADLLVSLALIASLYIGETFAAGEVAFIMQLGALLEDLTVANARAGIEKLVHLTPQTARVVTEKGENIIPAKDVTVGQKIRILPGETVPVDGEIIEGTTSINQAVMTGESLPVDKTVGDQVASGTVNQFGAFLMKATKVGEDSSIQRMIKLVQSADAGKAKIVGMADRWATWIVVIALTAAAITGLVTGELIRAVTILVVFCPCALVLATPTAIMAAIGNCTKHGFLVREGDALERLAGVSKITFDKTGTLTYGKPQVTDVKSCSEYTEKEIFQMLAAAEQLSEHPLGKAVTSSYVKKYSDNLLEVTDFSMNPGKGVKAKVAGKNMAGGNLKMMEELSQDNTSLVASKNINDEISKHLADGSTIIYVAMDEKLAGYVVLSDTLRKESKGMIKELKTIGVTPVLLTGDNENAANAIGGQLGIGEIHGSCLPENKLEYIAKYQGEGSEVCMIGDGINDAPALKKANVGIAMGGVGSDIAVDAADIALVDDDIKELPHLVALAKRMMVTIKINLTFSMVLNFVAIVLAMTGLLGPIIGALVHNAGSVLVIINSALLLKWKRS